MPAPFTETLAEGAREGGPSRSPPDAAASGCTRRIIDFLPHDSSFFNVPRPAEGVGLLPPTVTFLPPAAALAPLPFAMPVLAAGSLVSSTAATALSAALLVALLLATVRVCCMVRCPCSMGNRLALSSRSSPTPLPCTRSKPLPASLLLAAKLRMPSDRAGVPPLTPTPVCSCCCCCTAELSPPVPPVLLYSSSRSCSRYPAVAHSQPRDPTICLHSSSSWCSFSNSITACA
mmetsp:Transcript_19217/g.41527  ORF Transcript_19217/g.41527 Transcript_19217/m.41527 type:complete len:232 (+) Transcript_19217:1500-2195(+)